MTKPDPRSLAFSLRMWRSLLATQELLTVFLGVRLGLYDALADGAALTPRQLAARAGVDARYAREWLEHQAVAGIVVASDQAAGEHERAYSLPAAHATALSTSDDPLSMAALAVLPLGGIATALPQLLDAYRTGAGVADEAYGEDWLQGHSGANRALYRHSLAGWIEAYLPDVNARLAAPGRRAVDVACGVGWSSIALARAYPDLRVEGLDVNERALALAADHAEREDVGDRVRFTRQDAADPQLVGDFDLVCLFDSLHEMSDPVAVLRACRALRGAGGTVLVLDAKVEARFTAPGDEVEQFQYATSVLHCLPAARAGCGTDGTGTVLRPDTVRTLAVRAGFAAVAMVPVPDRFHRLYRLMG